LAVLVSRTDLANDAELLVLRPENAVLRRHVGQVRYESADLWVPNTVTSRAHQEGTARSTRCVRQCPYSPGHRMHGLENLLPGGVSWQLRLGLMLRRGTVMRTATDSSSLVLDLS
jgi:hypothetical protein